MLLYSGFCAMIGGRPRKQNGTGERDPQVATGFRKKSCLINKLERDDDSSLSSRVNLTFASFRQAVKVANIQPEFRDSSWESGSTEE
jgi:hypothetical protein